MAHIASFLLTTKLPIMPEVAKSLIDTLNDPDAGRTAVCDIIAKDPALTATLVRMANSAIFGLSRSVISLDSAVSVVGMSQIRARALSICMGRVFEMPLGLNRLDYWHHSMVCAGYSKWLASSIGADKNQAWLTGMMLRLGEIIIGHRKPAMIGHIEMKPCAPGERWAREKALTGFDEGQIMAEIARRWDFPDTIVEALSASAAPLSTETFSPLAAIVHLATLLSDQVAYTQDVLQTLPPMVVEKLQLDLPKLQTQLPHPESFSDISMMQT